jgi:hypothetical protein
MAGRRSLIKELDQEVSAVCYVDPVEARTSPFLLILYIILKPVVTCPYHELTGRLLVAYDRRSAQCFQMLTCDKQT